MEKEFYHFECLKSLPNIPELQLQEYCNILNKKLKEEFVDHRFRDLHLHDSSFNLFSNPMQINIRDDTDTWECLHPQQRLYMLQRTSRSLTQGHESILVTSDLEAVEIMGGSAGELSEELVTQEKGKKGWGMNCDVGEATERLENEL